MRKTEKPIVRNNALRNERVLEDQRKQQVDNPYDDDSEKRQIALDYIKRRKLQVKPLRKGNEDN